MTVEQLGSIAGVVLSLALGYIPGLAEWYANKDTRSKARIMGALLIIVALAIFAMACAHIIAGIGLAVVCTKVSLLQLVQILIAALIANQSTFMLAVRPFKR
jgi:hypothetical protein